MAGKQFILDLPSGTEFSIEDFVRMVNKNLKTRYTVRVKDGEELGTIPGVINKLHNRIVRIEDYLNDWTESQVKSNEVMESHLAILDRKITELDSWANTVINDTNRVINDINVQDLAGTRKYIFSVLDNVVKEINEQRQMIVGILDRVPKQITEKDIDRAIKNIELLDAALQKKQQQQQEQQKKKRGRPKKNEASSIKLTKEDITKAKEELAQLESAQPPQKKKRGRPRKDQQVPQQQEPVKNQKKKQPRSAAKKR